MHAQPFKARIAHVEGAFIQVNERLASIDRRLDSIDRRFDAVDRRFELVDRRLEGIDRRFDYVDMRFNYLLGLVVASWVTMIATQIGTTLTVLNHHR